MVAQFIDSSNYSTFFALQYLMGLDVITVLAPAGCHAEMG